MENTVVLQGIDPLIDGIKVEADDIMSFRSALDRAVGARLQERDGLDETSAILRADSLTKPFVEQTTAAFLSAVEAADQQDRAKAAAKAKRMPRLTAAQRKERDALGVPKDVTGLTAGRNGGHYSVSAEFAARHAEWLAANMTSSTADNFFDVPVEIWTPNTERLAAYLWAVRSKPNVVETRGITDEGRAWVRRETRGRVPA